MKIDNSDDHDEIIDVFGDADGGIERTPPPSLPLSSCRVHSRLQTLALLTTRLVHVQYNTDF